MKIFYNIDWIDFIKLLGKWNQLPRSARQKYLAVKFSQQLPAAKFGEELEMLVEKNFLAFADKHQGTILWEETKEDLSKAKQPHL